MVVGRQNDTDCAGGFTDIDRADASQDGVVAQSDFEVAVAGDLEVLEQEVVDAVLVACAGSCVASGVDAASVAEGYNGGVAGAVDFHAVFGDG